MALALFAVTLFVSAFILFLVQPIIGKTILPKLGGTPQVWNTCMVFFQSVLLLGYFYTHASSTRLSLRRQLILHCALLFVPFLILLPYGPFNITNWIQTLIIPSLGSNPLIVTLLLLLMVVGLPFFVVSTSAPLLQKWFGSTGHPAAKDPYFLYGASNLGSLLALVLYPIVIEPYMNLEPQKWMWTVGYGVLVLTVLVCAAMIWVPAGATKLRYAGTNQPLEPSSEGQPVPPPADFTAPASPASPASVGISATPRAPSAAAKSTAVKKGKPHQRPHGALPAPDEALSIKAPSDAMTTWRRLRWIGLAAVPSSLMLGVTTHMTTDLSPDPRFWLFTLAIYLLSFILVFSKWPVTWVDKPHTVMLYIQPTLIGLMIFMDIIGPYLPGKGPMFVPILFNILAFSATAVVCHGELAKDRPSTKHLTEFYLLMSFGGMLGGIFNGIIAPVVFIYVLEFSIAVICACLLRPKMTDRGWVDELVAGLIEQPATPAAAAMKGPKGQHAPHPAVHAGASASTSRVLDIALPLAGVALMVLMYMIVGPLPTAQEVEHGEGGQKYFLVYGLPLILAALYYGRPLRFGLAIMGVMIFHALLSSRGESNLYADRSYFGILRVNATNQSSYAYTQLTHGHINHGMNIFKPDNKNDWGNPAKDYSRLATTYYHRLGPAGVVMEKFNWFPGPENTYWADARMPASLIGQAALPLGTSILPVGQLVDLWSEPPYATIGLGTGTMASYGRPYQHVHYYEIDDHVRRLSLPVTKGDYYFTRQSLADALKTLPLEMPFTLSNYATRDGKLRTYFNCLKDAVARGSEVEVLMGDARLRMALPYKNHHEDHIRGGGPEDFYHMMVVDAFSSDAIPVHLITREAIEMYFKHLTKDGILCIHTSNRYVELPKVVAAVADDLKDQGYVYLRGHDQAPGEERGHFTSEWVMVAKTRTELIDGKEVFIDPLKKLSVPKDYQDQISRQISAGSKKYSNESYWDTPIPNRKYLWTDDHSNLWNVIR